MKESITKFDLEAAFKALDDIDIPVAGKVKANRPALTEIFSNKTKFDYLMEEYYDISNNAELEDAQEAREAEVAKAKLARIEKIVDLDADSPEDLLTSYVGKYIMQCPQCMTLFYKDPEDIVEAEDDPDTVNVNEVCQHCGNESGYTLIGKVGEATPEDNFVADDLGTEEELSVEEPAEEETEVEEGNEDDLGDLEALDLNLEDEDISEEDTKEESFSTHEGETLVEELDDTDLDAKLEAHSEYIEYLRTAITQEEDKLEKATNEQVKVAIQRNIDAFKADLEAALPEAVKNEVAAEAEVPEEEIGEETNEEDAELDAVVESLLESLQEEADLDISEDEFEELINSPEFKKPISDSAVRAMLDTEKKTENVDESLNNEDTEVLTEGPLANKAKRLARKAVTGIKRAVNSSDLVNNIITNLKSREDKVKWLLDNIVKDYTQSYVQDNGTIEHFSPRRFNVFEVICFSNKDKNGTEITAMPAPNNIKDLIVKDKKTILTYHGYTAADKLAKGWSLRHDNGPVFICMANLSGDKNAAFLCGYFKGNLMNDQVDNYINIVKNNLKNIRADNEGADLERQANDIINS
jgi:hypothetical protein